MPIIGYEDIAGFIKTAYPHGSKVVEVGVGGHPEVALLLKDCFMVICTDVLEAGPEGVTYVKDDIFKPNMDLYQGASLIYSLRPPVDMQDSIASAARQAGADLLIRPFASERADLKKYYRSFKCVNRGSAVFFLYEG